MERVDEHGDTPLRLASYRGNLPVVSYLVNKAGADVKKANKDGGTSLMFAAQEGRFHVVRFLVQAGADAERANKKGDTSLILAAWKGHLAVVIAS